MSQKHSAVGDLFHLHVASRLFILSHAICFLVERFQVLLLPYLISHRKQFILDMDLHHLDSCGVSNPSCLSFIFGKCFNGISKLCDYQVLRETQHLSLQWQMMLTVSFRVFSSSEKTSLMLQEIALRDNKVLTASPSCAYFWESVSLRLGKEWGPLWGTKSKLLWLRTKLSFNLQTKKCCLALTSGWLLDPSSPQLRL